MDQSQSHVEPTCRIVVRDSGGRSFELIHRVDGAWAGKFGKRYTWSELLASCRESNDHLYTVSDESVA